MSHSPFKIVVYDKAMQRRGWVGDPVSVSFTPRHNGIGTVEITMASDHARVPDLMARGARVVVHYGSERISGPVRGIGGEGPAQQGQITFTVEDDIRLLWRVLGWAAPTQPVTNQGDDETAYWRATGTGETVLKAAVQANAVQRLGLPVTVAPDQQRGAQVPGGVSLRFHPLADRLLTPVEQSGLGVTVRQGGPEQQGTGLVLDVYVPRTHPRALTEAGGTITDWKWNQAPPEATRVVAGGQGEGTAREFVQQRDAAREAEWGDVIEVFRDARDAEQTATLNARAAETLAEGAPTSGLSITLAETPAFKYGDGGVRVGDTVTARLANGVEITDLLREATITWTSGEGLTVVPTVGNLDDDPTAMLADAVQRLAVSARNQTTK